MTREHWVFLFAVTAASCASRVPSIDSESHFACATDADCTGAARGAICVANVCEPADGGRAASPRVVTVLAEGQHYPRGIVSDGSNVYWLNIGNSTPDRTAPMPNPGGELVKCAVGGCAGTPTELVSGILATFPSTIALGAGNVYFGDVSRDAARAYRIMGCRSAGCDGSPAELTPGFANTMTADANSVYWTDSGRAVLACATGGCDDTPITVGTAASPRQTNSGIAVDDEYVYWSTVTGQILKCPKTGCGDSGPTTLVSNNGAALEQVVVVVDAVNVYWISSQSMGLGGVFACRKSGCDDTPTVLVSGLSNAGSVATDGKDVYFTDSPNTLCCPDGGHCVSCGWLGRIAKCAVTGCDDHSTTVVADQIWLADIALDSRNVYWTTDGLGADTGQVLMIPK